MDFLRSLLRRGLKDVRLVTSDAHEGLKAAIHEALAGATQHRCGVHFMRNVLANIPKGSKQGLLPRSARSSLNQIEKPPRSSCSKWLKPCNLVGRRRLRRSLQQKMMCSPIWPFRRNTGPGSIPRIRCSGSTRRSSEERKWWALS